MRHLYELTNREHRVLALLVKGRSNPKIAHEMGISTRTVENHLYHIFNKLGVSSRTEAVLYVLNDREPKEMSRNLESQSV